MYPSVFFLTTYYYYNETLPYTGCVLDKKKGDPDWPPTIRNSRVHAALILPAPRRQLCQAERFFNLK
jgi:hypothetical protein